MLRKRKAIVFNIIGDPRIEIPIKTRMKREANVDVGQRSSWRRIGKIENNARKY